MSQSTSLTGSSSGSVHLASLFATMAYLTRGRLAVSALKMPLHERTHTSHQMCQT